VGGAITGGVSAERVLHGPPAQWVHELIMLVVGHDFDTFALWAEGPEQLSRFAEEIIPVVGARVARERAAG
jgi:hypothetical protein